MNPIPQHPKIHKTLAMAVALTIASLTAQAATWNGGTMSYNTPGNWSGGQVPSATVTGNAINRSGSNNVVQVNPGDPDWTLGSQDILMGDVADSSGSYLQNGPNVTLNYWFRMGLGGATSAGYAELDAGTLAVGGRLNVAEGGTAVFTMKGGTLTTGDNMALADGGTGNGTFNQTNGSATVGNELWVGNNTGAVGTMNLGGNASMTVNNWFAIGRNGSTGVINLTGNATLTKAGGNVITFAGLTGATANGTLNQSGSSTVNCANNDTWLSEDGIGIWNLNSGTATIATLQFGRNGGSSGTFNLNGGTLSVNQITLGAGSGTLNFNGGTLRPRGANLNFMSGVSGMLQAGGAVIDSQGFDITIPATMTDGAGGSLTKTGNGTLTLSGANTYLGSTIVNGGKLIEDVSTAVTSPVTVANTAGFGVNLSYASGQVNHTSLTLSGAANTLDFLLGGFGNPTLAPLNISGTLTINGTTTVNISDTLAQVGPIPLLTYANRSGAGSFVLGTLPPGVGANLFDDTVNKVLILNITSTAVVRWDGRVAGGVWDINTTTNWTDYISALPAKYTTGAAVFFDDLALGTTTVDLGVTVSPGSITVTNDLLPYTISGVGSITGASSLTKQGTTNLTISTTNSYTGPTTISGGTVTVNALGNGVSPSPLGLSSTNVASLVLDGGTLSYTGPATSTDRGFSLTRNSTLDVQGDITFNGTVNSTLGASLTKSGNGTLAYKLPGAATLSKGTYVIQNGKVLMDGSAGGQVNNINGELWAGGTTSSTGGSLVLSNTTLNVSSWLAIARGTGTGGYTSSVTMYNSSLKSQNGSMCYDNGVAGTLQTGILTLNGNSTYTNTGDSNLGESSGAMAIINLNDSSVFQGNNRMMVGWHTGGSGSATGMVTVANSAKIVCNAWFSIGNESGTGIVLLKDNGSLTCGDLNVNDVNDGSGTLLAQNNSTINAGNMWVGKGNGSVGYMLITNSASVVSANGLTLGQGASSTATVDLSGGSLAVNLVQGSPASGSFSTFNFNGGKLIAHPPYSGTNFVFGLETASVLAGGAVIEINSNDVRNIPQILSDGGGNGGLTKLGNGTLLLDGANTYTGTTTVSNGTLGGIGTITGPVAVKGGTTFAPGDLGVGTLTLGSTLNLAGTSTTIMEVNKTANTSDLVTGASTMTYGGTLVLKNLSGVLQVGDTFTLFSSGSYAGSFSSVVSQTPNQTVTWDVSQLVAGGNGTVKVAAVVAAPVTLTPVVSGGKFNLSWPADQIGWQLQSQVNPLGIGISTNWVPVAGSTATNQVSLPEHSTEPTEFFRLVFPPQ